MNENMDGSSNNQCIAFTVYINENDKAFQNNFETGLTLEWANGEMDTAKERERMKRAINEIIHNEGLFILQKRLQS